MTDLIRSASLTSHLCVERTAGEILAIACKAGWPARHCERGGGVFSLTEVLD